jgi:chemotaxis response regulator CheB
MTALLLVTEDPGFAVAAAALSKSDLTVTLAHAEETIAVARRLRPDVFAVDTDSVVEAEALITSLAFVTRSIVVAVAHQAWPGSEAADGWRRAGADAVLPKPSGTASPSMAGADREAYAQWFLDLVRNLRDDAP